MPLDTYGANTYVHTGHTIIMFLTSSDKFLIFCFRTGVSIVIFTQLVTGISTYLYQC